MMEALLFLLLVPLIFVHAFDSWIRIHATLPRDVDCVSNAQL
jgi:hypothetical protein